MTRPTVSAASEQIYRLYPDYMQAADEATDWTLLKFTAAIATGADPTLDFITLTDPHTSVSGTCELANPAVIPRPWLPWLGWLLGIDVSALPVATARDIVAAAPTTQRRGTRAAIKAAVTRTLDVTTPAPRVFSGSVVDPYLIAVVIQTGQSLDEVATLAAAWTEKPAGADMALYVVDGPVIADLMAAYPLISDLMTALPDVADVVAWTL